LFLLFFDDSCDIMAIKADIDGFAHVTQSLKCYMGQNPLETGGFSGATAREQTAVSPSAAARSLWAQQKKSPCNI
jgi:hypothetical protein